ncbi:Stk1 family PASTA domain-containing Ser/Thr kinase [Bifidobacterium samirii]|uniref:non-specific serine/threonine protein kinase n=1 Tax=Bifidobacterium samirii TaxID=2306974 RepID=A0A430FV88_9BIFI|nr:Stk1 family PASTA domain-containing Ser/Thr kinase [Bifidobacterium samirii]RSX57407.1 serine/threonine protein kinase [Bifidobacterium samirii]
MSNMPNSLADGRYQLGQAIGHGGMAEVRVALDTRLGRTVAIKIMRADLANDQIFLSRFRREAHAVAQMNNANIVNIYDSGEETVTDENGMTERLPYLVMEYVKGQTLRDIIKANGPISQRDAEQVMLGVLGALEYSHRMGIIHRDIKPGNIMISEQGVVKVMDFGIARALDDSAATMTQSQGVVGTAQYLSPEQARGETVDMRSDLYSAGCVLYEMLTGRAPFTGDSAVAIAYQHVSEVATPPSSLVPGLPAMWDSICAKAMAKDRQNRYATANEFKNDILTYMNGGMPVAAAFNPLTDLSNMKARKQAEQDAATQALGQTQAMGQTAAMGTMPMPAAMPAAAMGGETTATQAFNPVTGQFEAVPSLQPAGVAVKSRAEQRAEADRAKRKKIIIGSVVGVIVVIAALLAVFFMMQGRGGTDEQKVDVPDFTTMSNITSEKITSQLEDLGLVADIVDDDDSTEPEGTVTKQDPKGGASVAKGSTVKVWISTGPQSAKVPDVSDMTQDAARAALKKAGFEVASSTRSEDSAKIEKDKVVGTDPAAGTSEPKGTQITLIVSTGRATVPDLAGQAKDAAIQTLKSMGFESTSISEDYSATVAEGAVIGTTPEAGASVERGTTISIVISRGPQPVTVPYLIGQKYADAKSQLEALGLTVALTNGSSTSDTAIVTASNPANGNTAKPGDTVTLTTADPVTPTPDPTDPTTPGTDDNGNSSGTTTGQ